MMRERRLLLAAIVSLPFSGCAAANWFAPPAPFSDRAPCVVPPGAGKEQLVQHVNRNIQGTPTSAGLASWHSSSVKLSLKGVPIALPAQIAVEAPRNFRLRVSAPVAGGELVDTGANAEEFWFWAQDSPHPNVITASHGDLMLAQQRLNIPFQPDWLMEVLGVIPIDASQVTLRRPDPSSPIVELVSEQISPDGRPLRKIIRVNSCHGIILEHALYDSDGLLIASARLGGHWIDEATGIVMPRVISLDWPQMQQQLTLSFRDVRINPPPMPPAVWQVPEKPGYPRLELTQLLNGASVNGFSPFGAMGPPAPAALQPIGHQGRGNAPYSLAPAAPGRATVSPSAGGLPSAYSEAASRSSSGRRRRGRGLWRWPWW